MNCKFNMSRCRYILLLGVLFLRIDSAHSILGSGNVPLQDYYEFGKHQTGVASVVVRVTPTDNVTGKPIDLKDFKGDPLDDIKPHFGTANLVDVGIEQLKGRLLITAAHVIENSDTRLSYIRFMDENNESVGRAIQEFFVPSDWHSKQQDIGFILLKDSVNIEKFKPLKLNLSKDNRSFHGKPVNVFGCTPMLGKVNSKVLIRESEIGLLRRGMTTIIHEDDSDISELQTSFYSSKTLSNCISIFRPSTTRYEEASVQEKVDNIKVQMEEFTKLIENVQSDQERSILFDQRNLLCNELCALTVNSKRVVDRQGLEGKIIYYNEEGKAQLDQLNDTHDLNKPKLRAEWDKFVNDQRYGSKFLKIDAYKVRFYGPLPQLSGELYSGDSGGAWVIDDEIVGLNQFGVGGLTYEKRGVKEKFPERYENLSKYFDDCEEVLSQSDVWMPTETTFHSATSIWDCRAWIESTLEEITRSAGK